MNRILVVLYDDGSACVRTNFEPDFQVDVINYREQRNERNLPIQYGDAYQFEATDTSQLDDEELE